MQINIFKFNVNILKLIENVRTKLKQLEYIPTDILIAFCHFMQILDDYWTITQSKRD